MMANENEAAPRWGEGVTITAPALRFAHFEWTGDGEPSLEGGIFVYRLRVSREDELTIAVEFVVSLTQIDDLELEVSHRMTATLQPDGLEAREPDKAFRMFAAMMAPRSIYPFTRETMASLTTRALLGAFVLPMTNVAALFTPDEIEIPGVDDEESEADLEQPGRT